MTIIVEVIKFDSQADRGIDVFKMICAVLIVTIHIRPFLSCSRVIDFYVVDIIARLAVPFFYAATSYFFFRKLSFTEKGTVVNCRENNGKLANYLKRICLLYAIWSIVYLFWQVPYWYSTGWMGIAAIIDYIVAFCMKGSVYHFWYFVSLIYGILFLYILLQKIGIKGSCYLSIIFYGIKCLVYGYSWIGISMISKLEMLWNAFSGILDGICLALPFMMVGVIASQKNAIYRKILKYKTTGFILSIIGMIVEGSLLFFCSSNEGKYSYIAFTLPMCCFLFVNVIENKKGYNKHNEYSDKVRKCSTVLYCLHPLIIYLCELSAWYNTCYSLTKFLIVITVSMVVTFGIVKLKKSIKLLSYLM